MPCERQPSSSDPHRSPTASPIRSPGHRWGRTGRGCGSGRGRGRAETRRRALHRRRQRGGTEAGSAERAHIRSAADRAPAPRQGSGGAYPQLPDRRPASPIRHGFDGPARAGLRGTRRARRRSSGNHTDRPRRSGGAAGVDKGTRARNQSAAGPEPVHVHVLDHMETPSEVTDAALGRLPATRARAGAGPEDSTSSYEDWRVEVMGMVGVHF